MNEQRDGDSKKQAILWRAFILAHDKLSPTAKLIAIAILDHLGNNPTAWPAYRTLAAETHTSGKTIWACLQQLAAENVITSEPGGPHKSNHYKPGPALLSQIGDGVAPAQASDLRSSEDVACAGVTPTPAQASDPQNCSVNCSANQSTAAALCSEGGAGGSDDLGSTTAGAAAASEPKGDPGRQPALARQAAAVLVESGLVDRTAAADIAHEPNAADLELCRRVVANAAVLRKQNRLTNPGGYLREAIRGRYPLLPELVAEQERRARRQRDEQRRQQERRTESADKARANAEWSDRQVKRRWLATLAAEQPALMTEIVREAVERIKPVLRPTAKRLGHESLYLLPHLIEALARHGITRPADDDRAGAEQQAQLVEAVS